MTEPVLYRKLLENLEQVKSHNSQYFVVDDNIKLSMILLDTALVKGVYIDRAKNLTAEYYDVAHKDRDLYTYKRKSAKKEPKSTSTESWLKFVKESKGEK